MSNTMKLLVRVRRTTETGTDYAVAKALQMFPQNFRTVMRGKAWPGTKAQRLIAEKLGMDFADVNALVEEDKAKSDADRAYWRSLQSTRLHKASAIAITVMLSLLGSMEAKAYELRQFTTYTLCVCWRRLRASCSPLPQSFGPAY